MGPCLEIMSEYFCDTLDNGLRVISVPMPHHHSAEVLVYLGVGSRYETPYKAGVSHFLEHMLFKGTDDYSTGLALERAFEEVGGSANAATDTETTCFHSRVHPDRIAEGVELFASMLCRPRFNDLEMERRVILEEARGDLNETGRQINPDNLVAALLYPNHPMGQPTVGTRAAIDRLSLKQLKTHHATFYTPPNAVLAIAGPVEHSKVLAAVEQSFGGWQGVQAPSSKEWVDTAWKGPQTRWVRDAGSQVGLQLVFQLPGRNSRHAANLRVLRRLLGWGGMSRLMWRLREQLGLTYAVEAALALYADTGLLAVDLAVSPENLAAAVAAILELFAELHTAEIDADELGHLLASYRYDLDYSRDQVDEMALRYAWGELTGNHRTIAGDLADLETVTAKGLQQTVRELFTPERLAGAIVGPYRSGDRKTVEAMLAEWKP
jgi:predicted Zn-dependent peptidase